MRFPHNENINEFNSVKRFNPIDYRPFDIPQKLDESWTKVGIIVARRITLEQSSSSPCFYRFQRTKELVYLTPRGTICSASVIEADDGIDPNWIFGDVNVTQRRMRCVFVRFEYSKEVWQICLLGR